MDSRLKYSTELMPELSGYIAAGFNRRIFGECYGEACGGINPNYVFGQLSDGYYLADKLVRDKGEFFLSIKGDHNSICRVIKDGNAWFCHHPDFIDLQESDNYAFGCSFDAAVSSYIEKYEAQK